MRKLWEDHITWTRLYIVETIGNLPDATSTATRLLKNQEDIGKKLEEVVEMVAEAEAVPPEGRTRREIHRHVGDFALFWTGVYPEAVQRLRSAQRKDKRIARSASASTSFAMPSRRAMASPYDRPGTPLSKR